MPKYKFRHKILVYYLNIDSQLLSQPLEAGNKHGSEI